MTKQQGHDQSILPMRIDFSVREGVDSDKFSITQNVFHHGFQSPEPLLSAQTKASKEGWKMPTIAGISSALKSWWQTWWQTILVTSCVIAVVFDPLFFYIPYTSEDRKCMGRDNRVQTAALIFRSVTDITFLVHIVYQLYVAITFALSRVSEDESLVFDYDRLVSREQMTQFAKAFSYKLSWRSFLTDVLSILPLPQLLIVALFFDIGGNNYLLRRKIVSGFVLMQYLPRIYRIYLSSVAITESATLWVKGLFNFFLYILASHVLGAFWYFFSIQRETSCWYQNCLAANQSESQCTFYCHDNTTAPLITPEFKTTLDKQCLLKVPSNMTDPPFDFGIFFNVLKNDIQGKINVPQKIGYCFWWGLQNLSNFGTSLVTSTYLWECSFAILISIVGLLLFLYLIGNVQIYMERATTRAEDVREKLEKKKKDTENWMKTHGLAEEMKKEIRKAIKQKLEEDINADMDDIFSMLPKYTNQVVKQSIGMRTLKNVPMFRLVNASVLKTICYYLQPVKYLENTTVFHQGEPFDRMVFIIDGSMMTYTSSTNINSSRHSGEEATRGPAHFLNKGDAYGHNLLQLASSSRSEPPISVANVKCNTKVEAFVLMEKDLKKMITEGGDLWLTTLDFNVASSEDKGAVPEGQFQQQHNLKRRVASSTINPTEYNG